jgi:ABC-type multidrug transport system ATPase subunit|eukprot:COSAG02_NODE_157_length_32999_cov_31.863647_9_plen_129_part_00
MEEADALSTRIAIMTNGKIRCIGSSQELKAKYGQGYQLELQLRSMAMMETVVRFVKERWSGELTESFGNRLLFTLPPAAPGEPLVASGLFGEVETARNEWGVVEYAVSQPSLEQIFLKFAQDQRPAED